MWIVVAHDHDLAARWAADELREMVHPVVWLSAEQLGYAARWSYRLSNRDAFLEVGLGDGRTLRSADVRGVLNRLVQVPAAHMWNMQPADRTYVHQEMAAFYLSWLSSFDCPVLNPAKPNGLSGSLFHQSVWMMLAAKAGLRTDRYRLTSRAVESGYRGPTLGRGHVTDNGHAIRMIVVGGKPIWTGQRSAHPPVSVRDACVRLSILSGIPLLGIVLVQEDGDWLFHAAEPLTDLREGGHPLIEALAEALAVPERSRIPVGGRT